LTAKGRKALDRLLVIAVDQRRTAFQVIKRLPQRPSRKHLQESIKHLQWLESLSSEGMELMGVAPSLVAEFAKQARTTNAAELKRFRAPKRYTLLLSLIHNTKASCAMQSRGCWSIASQRYSWRVRPGAVRPGDGAGSGSRKRVICMTSTSWRGDCTG
jgi:hypothetical protein